VIGVRATPTLQLQPTQSLRHTQLGVGGGHGQCHHLRKRAARVAQRRRHLSATNPHNADTSVTGGTHFALVGQTRVGFCTQEGRMNEHKGVLFF